MDEAALEQVLAAMEWLMVGGGEVLLRAGDPGDRLYIVMSGRLTVWVTNLDGEEQMVRELGRGATLGEMALVTGEPRTATVRAVRDTVLGELSRARFDELVERNPQIALRLTKVLAGWIKPSGQHKADNVPSTVTLLPLPGTDLPRVLQQLERALGGKVRVLDAARVDAQLGAGAARSPDGDPRESDLAAFFDAEEAAHPLVLYVAELDEKSPWNKRAVRHADHVLVLAPPGARADSRAVAASLAALDRVGHDTPKELVLVRPSGAAPSGTMAWLKLAAFTRHHHVRDGHAGDWARLGRHLSGRTLGLVFGGGGARGFAHIGVLRALGEAGIDVDMVAGTSMGAMVGALWAKGSSPRQMIEENRRLWLKHNVLRDFSLPVIALLGPRKADIGLRELFGDMQIEDMPLEFFAVSTNLTQNKCIAHRTGLARRYVLASMSIPGVAPPIIENGDLLVDGGVLNILPTDLMRQAGAGTVVAVDVSPMRELPVDARHAEAPGWMEFVAGRFNPFQKKEKGFPSILNILERTAQLASSHISKAERKRSEICYIDPPVRAFDTFDMKSLVEIEEIGYRHTLERISAVKEACS